jgi:hypothetical protein
VLSVCVYAYMCECLWFYVLLVLYMCVCLFHVGVMKYDIQKVSQLNNL